MYAYNKMKRCAVALAAALACLSAGAQTDAERAQQAAREAAAKAAEARRKATVEATKNGLRPVFSEEATRLAEEQAMQKQKAREQMTRKARKAEMSDSAWRAENRMKLQTWRRKLFVGGQLGSNFAMADNITDHPPFRWGEAWGVGANVYVGKFFSRGFGVRGSLSYQNVRNRVDRETVEEAWIPKRLYSGNGFFRFNVLETNADILFDISGTSYSNRFHPFRVHFILGTGLSIAGKKRLHGDLLVPDVRNEENQIMYGGEAYPSFESRVETKTHALWTLRTGLLFDYRFSQHFSANMEGTATFSNDNFEGIKFDEPFDILLKGSVGVTYWF